MSEIRTMVRREMDTFKVERLSENGWKITWQPSGLDLFIDSDVLEARYIDADQYEAEQRDKVIRQVLDLLQVEGFDTLLNEDTENTTNLKGWFEYHFMLETESD